DGASFFKSALRIPGNKVIQILHFPLVIDERVPSVLRIRRSDHVAAVIYSQCPARFAPGESAKIGDLAILPENRPSSPFRSIGIPGDLARRIDPECVTLVGAKAA